MSADPKADRRSLPVVDAEPVDWEGRFVATFSRVHTRWERRLTEVLAGHDMTLPQFDVLATLWHGEGITQQELAERLLVTKGNVVGLVDRLCGAGLIERRDDPADRRANRLHLTKAGRKRLAAAGPSIDALRKQVIGAFTADELRSTVGMLRRLETSLEE